MSTGISIPWETAVESWPLRCLEHPSFFTFFGCAYKNAPHKAGNEHLPHHRSVFAGKDTLRYVSSTDCRAFTISTRDKSWVLLSQNHQEASENALDTPKPCIFAKA